MKKYKRLTQRNENDEEISVLCKRCLRKDECDFTKNSCFDELVNRLSDFEDKIDSKKIIEFRCNLGDSVYCISQINEKVYKYKIQEIIIMKNGICYELESKLNGELNFFFESDFDKCWFTDKNKAELKLSELIKEKKKEKEREKENCKKKRNYTKKKEIKND